MFRIHRQAQPSAFFLAVTPDPQTMQRLLEQADIDPSDYHLTAVPHHEVPGYLARGDVGLLREPCLVNRVASPVKFAEYLAAGLPVLLTEEIGDYSSLAASCRRGCVLPHGELPHGSGTRLRRFLTDLGARDKAWHERCRQTAEAELSLDRHCRRVVGVYEGLISRDALAGVTT